MSEGTLFLSRIDADYDDFKNARQDNRINNIFKNPVHLVNPINLVNAEHS